jgi:hypothetical protein
MEVSADATPTSPGGKSSQFLAILRNLLDTLLIPVLAVFSALVIGGIFIVVTDASVYDAFQ